MKERTDVKIYVLAFYLLVTAATCVAQDVVRIPADGREFSTALTTAIRQLPGGGTVQLEAGTYVVARPCDPGGADNITIQGVGPRTVIQFHQRYFGKDDRWIMNVTDQHDHWSFREFTFDGNSRFSPKVCDRDKIVKLRGDFFTVERVTVQNEAGRGFVTILGDDSRWLNCTFNNIGTNAGDSSVVHPGNKFLHAHRVLVSGCMGDLGRGHKTTFVDAVASDVIVTNNVIRGGKTGVILSWWKGAPENAVISNNILQSSGRSCRLNRKRKQGEYPRVVITNNVLVGPLQNQFGTGFVDSGNTLTEPLRIQEPGFQSKN
jgi:hypothetical protein